MARLPEVLTGSRFNDIVKVIIEGILMRTVLIIFLAYLQELQVNSFCGSNA